MNKAINQSIFLIVVMALMLIIFSAASIAGEDFKASSKKIINVCACSSVLDTIQITNTGYLELKTQTLDGDISTSIIKLDSGYSISASGDAAAFFTIAHPRFILSRDEELTNYGYITAPCDAEGDYELFIDIETDSGIKKRISQIISVKRCPNLRLIASLSEQVINPCAFADYSFIIENTGDFEETYNLDVDELRNAVSFSKNPVKIGAGSSKSVYMHIAPDCEVLDDKEITLRAQAVKSGFYSELPFILRINKTYYDYDLMLDSAQYNVCQASKAVIPLIIRNHADRENLLHLELEGKGFAKLSSEKIILVPSLDNSLDINLNIDSNKEGIFNFTISAESDVQDIIKSIDFSVNVESCHGIDFDGKRMIVNYSAQSSNITITNTASKRQEYIISTDCPEWVSVEPGIVDMAAGEQKTLIIISEPNESVEKGKYEIIIKVALASDESIEYSEQIDMIVSEKEGFAANMLYLMPDIGYILFALFDILLILAGIILYKSLKKKKGPRQKTLKDIEKEAKKQQKLKSSKEKPKPKEKKIYGKTFINKKVLIFTLIGVIILGILAASGFYMYTNFYAPSGNETLILDLNNTNESIIEDALEDNMTLEASYTSSIKEKLQCFGDTIWLYLMISLVFLYTYKWYIITCIVLLIAVILSLRYTGVRRLFKIFSAEERAAKKEKKRVKKEKKDKEEKKKEKTGRRRMPGKGMIAGAAIMIIAISLAGLYFSGEDGFWKFKPELSNISLDDDSPLIEIDALNNVSRDYGIKEEILIIDEQEIEVREEIIVPEEELSQEDIINSLEGPVLIWEMNTNLTIDLKMMFFDPDGDILSFLISTIKHMDSSIDLSTGIATLVPEDNWTGISAVWFTADDGKGGITTSDKINLIVTLPEEKTAVGQIRDFASGSIASLKNLLSDYAYYIVMGFIILIILILITRYNKHLIHFLEDESPEDYIKKVEKKVNRKKAARNSKGKKKKKKK